MIKQMVGAKVKSLRIEKGLSQEELASLSGLDRTYITYVENAKKNVTIETLYKITTALNISLSDFFDVGDELSSPEIKKEEIKLDISDLKKNQIYSNKELMAIFKCSSQGGIRVSLKKKTITIISKKNNNPYSDSLLKDNRVIYTGMGRIGDQEVKDNNQNGRVAFSSTNGYKMYYFISEGRNEYKYMGEAVLEKEYYFTNEKDENGDMRKVVKYPLRIK